MGIGRDGQTCLDDAAHDEITDFSAVPAVKVSESDVLTWDVPSMFACALCPEGFHGDEFVDAFEGSCDAGVHLVVLHIRSVSPAWL